MAASATALPEGTVRGPARPLAPRPLPLHLLMGNLTLLSSFAGLPSAKLGSLPWNPALGEVAASLARELAAADGERLFLALAEEVEGELAAFLRGVQTYRRHPYRRALSEPAAPWRAGAARLLDYGDGSHPEAGEIPVLFVPSLVNPAYILDLSTRRSLLRHLAGRGLRPYLLDWGSPGSGERHYSLADYVCGPLQGALAWIAARHERPPALAGYCMGGTLAVAAACHAPDLVERLVLLAAPWDFHADGGIQARIFAGAGQGLTAAIDRHGILPVDWLQAAFLVLDPALSLRKFAAFARLDPASAAAEDFVALEDWLNDGADLAGPAAEDCLVGWYGENLPGRGLWRMRGRRIDPRRLPMPALVVVPAQDRIVPPSTARPLAGLLPAARLWEPGAGHIGMMAGSRAESLLYEPLAGWLAADRKSL
ncbi:MAG: alpha/beta fold hydrolase [Alphaproteobacteria bacterium]|nr:alpha/beta fold hydrolase [Alphaproteobacteria bacterium]